MKKQNFLYIAALVFFISGRLDAAQYTGSQTCFKCHENQYNTFIVSGHPYKLMKAEQAKFRPIPLPPGYNWDDISYVIGGAYKKSRYIDKQGYIITAAKDGSDLKTQYNLETGTWSFYHKGEKKPYTCGKCHTTGFKASGNQGDLPGIKGTWFAEGIQCEACHGPGSEHVKNGDKSKIQIDKSASACGKCHSRGKLDTIPSKKGFIRHHEQYNEILASPHKNISCVVCHDPHKRVQFSIKKTCENCHTTKSREFKNSIMQKAGVICIDCHLPRATKSAVAATDFEGDIRTHLFYINTDPQAKQFYEVMEGDKKKTYSNKYVTLDFACLNCHKNKSRKWAAKYTKNIHGYGK